MLEEKLASINGIVDVSLIVVSHYENPARMEALRFLRDVLKLKIRALIPTTAFIGAYHILTNYLKVPRKEAKDALIATLNTKSKAIYEDVSITDAVNAIDYAALYRIESWDGYLISLAKRFNAKIIYTIDKKLQGIEDVIAVNPIPEDKMREYHSFLEKLLKH